MDKPRYSGCQIHVYIIIIFTSQYMWRVVIRRLGLFVCFSGIDERNNERNLRISEFWEGCLSFLLFGLGENNTLLYPQKIE